MYYQPFLIHILYLSVLVCHQSGMGWGDVVGYSSAAATTMVIGHALGKLTESIHEGSNNSNMKTFCVGHSLGAHVCGFTGKTKTNLLDGIFALDPAGPIFHGNSVEGRLDKGDAKFVKAMHMDAGELGIDDPVADVDVYVNSGRNQPRCFCEGGGLSEYLTEAECSHSPFTQNFFPTVWKRAATNADENVCRAKVKCSNGIQAMVLYN